VGDAMFLLEEKKRGGGYVCFLFEKEIQSSNFTEKILLPKIRKKICDLVTAVFNKKFRKNLKKTTDFSCK
jgi:hypothetical protein